VIAQELARRHYATRFVRVDVKDVPFLVDRLKIQVLPCIVSFVNGITVDRYGGEQAPFIREIVLTCRVRCTWLVL